MIKIYSKDHLIYGYCHGYNNFNNANIIYSEIPTDGLIFYNSFSNDSTIAETGQQLNITNNSYITKNLIEDDIPCWNIKNNGSINITENNVNYGKNPITLSIWIKRKSILSGTQYGRIISLGGHNQYTEFALSLFSISNSSYLTVGNGDSGKWTKAYYTDINKWYHALACSDGSTAYLYINGIFYKSVDLTSSNNVSQSNVIRISGYNSVPEFNLSSVRVYNRMLEPKEIRSLSKEFKI